MAVEDHPRYAEWLSAFDHRNEAERRYIEARLMKSHTLNAAQADLQKAQAEYNKICGELD